MECCENNNHKKHEGHKMNHSMGHGSAQSFLNRFWIVTVLLVPLVLSNEKIANYFGLEVLINKYIGFGIATIIFLFSLVFFQHAWHEIKARKYGMMTLVSIAVLAGYLFSAVSAFVPYLESTFYIEISTLIWVLLFGHYLEAKSGSSASSALKEVAKLLPKKAHRISGGKEEDVEIVMLKMGDLVVVKPGEKVPSDGIIEEGSSNMDESLVSGESKPVYREKGGSVISGSICLDGSLTIKVSKVGDESTIGQIKKLILGAQSTKPNYQKMADKASGVLTFIALGVSILTMLIWFFVLGESLVFSVTLAITVLVIACPHALGLAIPTVTTIATSLSLRNGVFIKDLSKIEIIKKANYVVFDKTGTLTFGDFGVSGVRVLDNIEKDDLIAIAYSIEKYSSHVIGQAIVKYAEKNNIGFKKVNNIKNIAGKGIIGEIDGQKYYVGNKSLMNEFGIEINESLSSGDTLVYVSDKNKVLGVVTLSDSIREESYEAINSFHEMGIKVAMLTGDNESVAREVSQELKIDTYFSNVLPDDKYKKIKELQNEGNIVLMVGDGVNDAPALTQADVGIAVKSGTDVAVESGDVVLMNNDPMDVVKLIRLSKTVYVKMVQNLIWALGYNIIAIPAAAGVFAFWGFFLRPEIGAFVMSLSTVIVVLNAFTLYRFK